MTFENCFISFEWIIKAIVNHTSLLFLCKYLQIIYNNLSVTFLYFLFTITPQLNTTNNVWYIA